MKEKDPEFFQPEKPKLQGTKVVGKIELKEKNKKPELPEKKEEEVESSKKYPKHELELRAKVGYQFDKIWKEKQKSRLQMQIWAIHLLELKMKPEDFSINKLDFEQVKVLGLKLKFEFNIFG